RVLGQLVNKAGDLIDTVISTGAESGKQKENGGSRADPSRQPEPTEQVCDGSKNKGKEHRDQNYNQDLFGEIADGADRSQTYGEQCPVVPSWTWASDGYFRRWKVWLLRLLRWRSLFDVRYLLRHIIG